MNYFDCRSLLSPWTIVLLLVHSIPSFTLQIKGLQVINDDTGTFSGPLGFPRNFSSEYFHTEPYSFIDAEPLSFFCSAPQRSPFQQASWPRLKAAPGSTICSHYVLDTLSTRDRGGKGIVQWYGSSYDNRTDYESLSDIINLPEDGMGQALAMHSYPSLVHSGCPTPFRIPEDLKTSSIYTIYWLWNTTKLVETGFQIYTTCFDIEIMAIEPSIETPSLGDENLMSLTLASTHFICPTLQASRTDRSMIGYHLRQSSIATQASVLESIPSSKPPSFASISTSSSKTIPHNAHDPSVNEVTKFPLSIPLTVAGKTSVTPARSPSVSSAASTHTVKLTSGDVVTFDRKYLDVSVGDSVVFKSPSGSFFLFNTTFEDPCHPIRQIENESQNSVLYSVQNTDPAWLLACDSSETCRCYPPSHFALNPGMHSSLFFDGIKHKSVYFSKTTAQPTRSTTTKVVVVTV